MALLKSGMHLQETSSAHLKVPVEALRCIAYAFSLVQPLHNFIEVEYKLFHCAVGQVASKRTFGLGWFRGLHGLDVEC